MKRGQLYILAAILVAVLTLGYSLPSFFPEKYSFALGETDTSTGPAVRMPTHVATPTAVKGIYMTACAASTPSFRDRLTRLVEDTELNAVVIDLKTYDGFITFSVSNPLLKPAEGGGCFVKDMWDLVDLLHAKGIYVVGRIAVFQDQFRVKTRPDLAVRKNSNKNEVWRDYKGIAWIDTGSEDHWDYVIALGREAYAIGFDELNFDYIRFPADGNMKDIYFPISQGKAKQEVVESFFSYLHEAFKGSGVKVSGDIFGMTTTNTDDLNIGQVLERALPYFDYVMPMVYPSHYPNNFMNLGDPNKHPYDVVFLSMKKAVERARATSTVISVRGGELITSTTPPLYVKPAYDIQKLRPWLQDNNYPVPYTPEMVRAQIKATYDTGLTSWMLWDAGNRYTKAALLAD